MIERLPTSGSIPGLAMRRGDLGKDALRLVPIGAQQSTRCGGLSLMKDLRTEQKNGVCVGMVAMQRDFMKKKTSNF